MASIVVALGTLGGVWWGRRKQNADAGLAAGQSVGLLLAPLNERIGQLEKQLKVALDDLAQQRAEREHERAEHAREMIAQATANRQLNAHVAELTAGVRVLIAQLEGARMKPAYYPSDPPGPLTILANLEPFGTASARRARLVFWGLLAAGFLGLLAIIVLLAVR